MLKSAKGKDLSKYPLHKRIAMGGTVATKKSPSSAKKAIKK